MLMVEKIKLDADLAKRNNDTIKSIFLITLLAEIQRIGFDDGKRKTTDLEALEVVKKFVKNANEIINIAPNTDNAKKAEQEIIWLKEYMPAMLSETELRNVIVSFVENNAGCKMSQIMAHLKSDYANLYDGKLASTLAKEMIN